MISHLERVLGAAWAPSTAATYGTGLAIFHSFCDHANIAEADRAPAPRELLEIFAAALAGVYAPSTITNYVAGVKAWHIIHGLDLNLHKPTMNTILRAAINLAPPETKMSKRKPFRTETICAIKEHLNLSLPLDAAVFTCLTTTFWCAARLGEFTVKKFNDFNPKVNITRGDMSEVTDRFGNYQ